VQFNSPEKLSSQKHSRFRFNGKGELKLVQEHEQENKVLPESSNNIKYNPKIESGEEQNHDHSDPLDKPARSKHKDDLRLVDLALVDLQQHIIKSGRKILVILEGRDGAGKDGVIRRVTKHMSPRDTRVVALAKPTEQEGRSWYFERYTNELPLAGEIVFFNRSWYNRAGVERVMGFCKKDAVAEFFKAAPIFEELLVHCGFELIKYYLDISKTEQKKRLKDRHDNPLKQWKRSSVDDQAIELWQAYSEARNEMLERTHRQIAPWTIVKADDKAAARLAVMRDLQLRIGGKGKHKTEAPDPDVIFSFDPNLIKQHILAK
jgi:polyphosphate kinase 2